MINLKAKVDVFAISVVMIVLSTLNYSYAISRNDVFAEIEKIDTNWSEVSVDLWINDFKDDAEAGILVGDKITYHVETDSPAYYAFILVDSKGNTSVLKPDALTQNGISAPSDKFVFPSIGDNGSVQGVIEQAKPLGKETIFVLVADQKIPDSLFDLDTTSDYVSYGNDLEKVQTLVGRVSNYAKTAKIAMSRYEYFVDGGTQFSTRGIRREISNRIEEVDVKTEPTVVVKKEVELNAIPAKSRPIVINDIKFEYNSDVLTITGMSQLEVLGSELIDRQEQNELPRVRLTGHTDSTGPADYNMALSKRRSQASKRFLVDELGLPGQYIDTHGMGETVPMDSNETANGRARNRRVEFEIVQ